MIDGKKVILIYSDMALSRKDQITNKVSFFLGKVARLTFASSSSSQLVLFLEFSSRIHRSIDSLKEGLLFEGESPSIFPGNKKKFDKMTENWNKKWTSSESQQNKEGHSKPKLKQSCSKLLMKQITLEEFFVEQPAQYRHIGQYQAAMTIHKTLKMPVTTSLPKKRGHFLMGKSNTGKTTAAINILFKGLPFYVKDLTTLTFDGYEGESCCLIDDLNPRSPLLPLLKNLLNISYARVNVKFGSLKVNFEIIVITTQYSLSELTPDSQLRAALCSRMHFWTMTDGYQLTQLSNENE